MKVTILDTDAPRAWVGCLGCYNGGTLNGQWVTGTVAADVSQAVAVRTGDEATYGKNCPVCVRCGSDEFWVMDLDNYGDMLTGECSPADAQRAAELLEQIADHDHPAELRAYIANNYTADKLLNLDDAADSFANNYIGTFIAFREYANEAADDMMHECTHAAVTRYFDYDAWARDLEHDYTVLTLPDGDVAVFSE